jgi:hypothetical protein
VRSFAIVKGNAKPLGTGHILEILLLPSLLLLLLLSLLLLLIS